MTGAKDREALTTEPDHVVVRVGAARFALPLPSLIEVVPRPPIARLPFPPAGVIGLISVRDGLFPLLDLGERVMGRRCGEEGRVLITTIERTLPNGERREERLALLVDGVEDVVRVEGTDLSSPPDESLAGMEEGQMRGVVRIGEKVIAVLSEAAWTMDHSNGAGERDDAS